MAWNYAELSKAAKTAGGPEKLVNMIEQGGRAIGRAEGQSSMLPWLGLVAVSASALTVAVIKITDRFKTQKAKSQTVVEQAKVELVQGIKDYDAATLEAPISKNTLNDNTKE